jgi:hypothetical protein
MADDRRQFNARVRSLEDRMIARALYFWTAREGLAIVHALAIVHETLSLLSVAVLLAFTVLVAVRH